MSSILRTSAVALMAALNIATIQSSILGDGFGYQASTDVSDILNLALDLKAMRLAKDDLEEKRNIYENGKESTMSLRSLSFDAVDKYANTPYYNIYRAGYELLGQEEEGDDPLQFDGVTVDRYADTVVQDLFLLDVVHIEAEAALAMNVGMAFLGSLWNVLNECSAANEAGARAALDEAAAFWIGEGQVKGDGATGFFFYNMAQFLGTKFNQFEGDSEALVNKAVLASLVTMQQSTGDGSCANGSGYKALRDEVRKLVGYFNRVLVQMLLHRVETIADGEDTDFVELYSLALLPQISSCNPDAYYKLVELTIESNITPDTQNDVIETIQSVYSCLHITCQDVGAYMGSRIPACNDDPEPKVAAAGYQPTNDVRKFLAMDRDIRQIRWMMKFGAYQAAEDFYEHGWNGIIPFGNIAKNNFLAEIKMTTDFTNIADHYGEEKGDTFHNIITAIFKQYSPFDRLSNAHRASMVDGFLKGPLTFLATTGAMESALFDCENENNEALRRHWDEAVAFFIGSTEGPNEGGAETVAGDSLWGLGDFYCEYFGDCTPSDAEVNERILQSFKDVQAALGSGQCEQISNEYYQSVRPDMLVAMVQGTLYSYIQWSQGDEDQAGYAFAFSRILLPVFSKKSDETALRDFGRLLDYETDPFQPTSDKVADLVEYLTTILQTFPLDCQNIGAVRESPNGLVHQVCPGDISVDAPPVPAPPTPNTNAPTLAPSREFEYTTPTRAPAGIPKDVPDDNRPLGWNRYRFVDQATAENDSMFSLDIKKMWTNTSLEGAQTVYERGGSVSGGLFGHTDAITTIKGLNQNAANVMQDDIMYNFYQYARYDDSDFDADLSAGDPWPYGNAVVELALKSDHGDSVKLAAEAAIVMNIWMMIVHQLYESARQCKDGTNAATYIDSAVGLWIGQEQGEKRFDTGWSIYSVAQEAYKLFGNPEDEAPVNTKLMVAFQDAQETARTCTGDRDGAYKVLRVQIDEIIHHLSTPLLQMLLYYLSVQDTNYIELFSLAFIPQIITCNIDVFGDLSEGLFQASVLQDTDESKLYFLDHLAGGLSCLRYTCADLPIGPQASQSLTIIVNDICDDMTNDFGIDYLAAYQVGGDDDYNRKIHEFARIDLDVLQIEILMKANDFRNAQEIFEYGRNSRTDDYDDSYGLFSLKQLSEDPVRENAGDMYKTYTDFYGSNFGGSIVSKVLSNSLYNTASRLEKAEAVVRAIQTSVTFVNIVGRLKLAVANCKKPTGSVDPPVLVDEAAALFVGSIEGSKSAGSETSSGVMLMALGKEMCRSFGTCATQNDATANEFIIFALSDLKEWFEADDCDSAEQILQESLITMLPVSMIQGTLEFAYRSSATKQDGNNTAADVVSQSIIPLVNASNETSASILISNLGYDSTSRGTVNMDKVVDAIAYALRGMRVDCNAIGSFGASAQSLCRSPEEDIPPVVDTPTDLGNGKFTTTTYVQDRADIAKDVQQMRDQLGLNPDLARNIYTSGENSPIYDKNGVRTGERSLKGFSTKAIETMKSNPLYQTTVLALREANGNYLNAPAWQYADSIVQESFGKGGELAADAAVALNLWMETSNELFTMLSNCRNQKLKDDDGIHSIDEAAAYWLGDAKTDSGIENGHLLYAFAEEMAAQFDTVGSIGQATANTNLLQLFQAAKLELSYPAACSDDANTDRRIRHLVNQAVSQMMVPMVQALIHYILVDDKARVRIYAHAVVPQVLACSPSAFDFLKGKLLDASYAAQEIDAIVLSLQSVYGCLGITCDDIGDHQDSQLDIDCDDDEIEALSGYRTRTDAGEYAQLDLDIQELDVLMAMEAYDAAYELYRFGRHAKTGLDGGRVSLSLQSVATNTARSAVPEFSLFEQFYDNNADYADRIMLRTFETTSSLTPIQRRYVAVGTAQYMIMYMGALTAMQEAIDACVRDSSDIGASQYWDRAAAYIIGHMEGQKNSGSKEGRLIWGLAKRVCNDWGTCSATVEGNAVANERILSLLYTGRGALSSGRRDSCPGLRNAASELRTVLLGPLIQGAISAVVKTSESSGAQREQEHAKAHALASAILPLIENVNREAANTIRDNLDFDDAPLSSGVKPVVDSFTSTMKGMGVDCGDVGASATVDSCSGQVSDDSSNTLLVIIIIALSFATVGVGFLAYRKRRNNKTKDEPVFIPNEKGELSHNEVIGNGSASRMDAGEIMHNDADAAADDDFEHAELPETV